MEDIFQHLLQRLRASHLITSYFYLVTVAGRWLTPPFGLTVLILKISLIPDSSMASLVLPLLSLFSKHKPPLLSLPFPLPLSQALAHPRLIHQWTCCLLRRGRGQARVLGDWHSINPYASCVCLPFSAAVDANNNSGCFSGYATHGGTVVEKCWLSEVKFGANMFSDFCLLQLVERGMTGGYFRRNATAVLAHTSYAKPSDSFS